MKKRLFALFLCLCMVMTLLPVGAFAEGTEAQFGLAAGGASVTSVNPVETPDTHITFKFYNGETLLDTQVVNDNGQLTAPATPAIEGGRKFLGWYAVVDATGQLEAQEFDFSTAYTNYSGRSEVKVMAKFEAVFYVYFMTVDGQVHSTAIANAANDFKVTPPTDYEPNGKVVTGWTANDAVFTADTVVTADTYVYPVTEDCYWVTFNTTGGSMVGSRSVTKGDTLNLRGVTAPTRTGYSFKGWSTTADGANVVTSIAPTADTTLYAVWEGDNVTYTVVYWGENPNNTATENIPFDTLLGTESKTAKVGTTVTGSASTANNNTIKNYFTYHSSDSAVVKADNSTVINVYYTRRSFSVTFDLGIIGRKSMIIGDITYSSGWNATKYVLTAKYEQNIESLWPTASNFSSGSNFSGWSVDGLDGTATSKRVTMTADLCSSSGKTAKANYDASCLDHLYYMFESFDQTSPANGNERKQYGNVYYDKSDAYSQDANSGGGNWRQKEITGMTASGKHTDVIDSAWFEPTERNVFLYYTRNEYDFIKNNYGTVASEKVKFGASLADKGGEPARPAGFSENAVFKGWYEVPVGQITDSTLPYDFTGKTMPASKLTLFAYWVEKPVTLTVQVPTLGGYTASNYEVAIGTVISGVDVFKDAEAKIAAAGRTVLKWVYEDGTAVDVNSAIGSDTTVKAVLEGEVYNLTYVTGTDAAITDKNSYEYEARAQVKDGSGLKSGDKVFACWTDETGKVYYPGSYVTMTGNKTLTANYVEPSVKVTLTYHSNFDTDQTKTIDAVPNNDKVSVMDYTSTGLPSRLGYQVKGWKDANGVEYAAGSEARLDNSGSNDLYAVWEASDVDYTVEFYYQNTDGTYPTSANSSETRQGKTDSTVSVTAADKADKENGKYVYDGDAANVEKGVVAANGSLVLKLYFKLNQASCTVRYLWNGTEEQVADDKVVPDMTVSQTYTESPITVDGYTYVSSDSKSITIVPDSSKNVITFYYYKNVTLTANSDTLEYNGFEQSVSGFTGAPEDADFSAIAVGAKGTDAGVYPAEFADGTVDTVDATGKYIVTKANDGSLVISPISTVITITANSKTREYNGEALTDNGYTFTEGVLVNGDILHVVVKGSVTDVDEGEVVNKITSYYVTTRDGSRDVTKNYTFEEPVNGTLKITPREITLTSGSDEKIYDGTPLTNSTVTVGAPGFVDGEGATYTVTGSQTEVGESNNSFTYKLNDNTKASNYTITPEYGKLKVNPVTDEVIVTITENSGSYKYDGTEKTVTGYKVTSISNPLYKESDFTFSGDATIKGTDAGTYDMNLVPGDFTNSNKDFTNVTFVIVNGTLVNSPRTLTITSGSDSKEYDGTPLTSSEIKVSGDGFVDGEGASYTFTGSQTNNGSSKNIFDYELNANTKAKNYEITKEYGDLTVTAVSTQIVITANSGEKMYDGSALINGGYTFTSGILVDGDVLTAVVEGSQLNAGSSANVVKSYRVMRGETDVTANYRFAESVDGKLTVTARKVVMTSADDEKVYDGTPLTNDEITVTGDGFIEGEGVTYDVTGSQLDVGSSDNSFTYELNEGTLAENYIIETEEGKLTVTSPEQHIVITANSAEKTYDGTPLTDDGFTYTDFVLAEGDVLEAVVEGSQTDAGSSVNVIKSYRVMRGDEDVTANYIFDDSVDGTLTVTKRKVTLTSGTACKIYDGKYLTCNKVEVGGDGFVEGEGATYDVTGKRKDIGWSYNDFTYKLNDNTKADNYEITVERGFLYVKDQAEKPKTGDSSDLLLLLALMSMSGAGAAGTVYLYRRKREEQE